MSEHAGRRVGLNRAAVIAAALDVTEQRGLDELTVRAVADHLGVWPTTVHHHVGDIEAIKDAVADAVVAQLPLPSEQPPRHWRRWLRSFAEESRLVVRRYPGVARRVQQRGPTSQSQIQVIDRIITGLHRAGFAPSQAAMAYSLLLNWIVDVGELEAYRLTDPATADRYRSELQRITRNQGALLPGLELAAPTFLDTTFDEYVAYGLDVLLDGIARNRSPTPQPRRRNET